MRPCRARAARSYFLVEGSSCGGMLLGSGDDFARSFNRSNSPSDNGVPCIGAPRGSPPSESFALSAGPLVGRVNLPAFAVPRSALGRAPAFLSATQSSCRD